MFQRPPDLDRPSRFLWGVSTSAFQLEGSPGADWSHWDGSLIANPEVTHHYRLYREDLDLLKTLGVNAYRFSLEWSRIQPEEQRWDEEALNRYQEIIDLLNAGGIVPMLTIHHFTHPLWFTERYPWHTAGAIERFLKFVDKVLSSLNGVDYWVTFNEPYVLWLGGYLEGCMPPGLRDFSLAKSALVHILRSHGEAYDMIRAKKPAAMVGLAHNMAVFSPWQTWNPLDHYLRGLADNFYNRSLIEALRTGALGLKYPFRRLEKIALPVAGKADFFGVNYYTRIHIRFNPFRRGGVDLLSVDRDGYGLSDMGWEIHPGGLTRVLRQAAKLEVPLIVTENGIAAHDTQIKNAFLKRHVDAIEHCRDEGIDVRGYFYWSLMDNYEWLQGLDARFGLYRVDYNTLERRATNAAVYYAHLIKTRTPVFNKQASAVPATHSKATSSSPR